MLVAFWNPLWTPDSLMVKEDRYKYLTMNSTLSNNEYEYLTKMAKQLKK